MNRHVSLRRGVCAHPLDHLLSKLDCSTNMGESVPNRVALEISRERSSQNVSFGARALFAADKPSSRTLWSALGVCGDAHPLARNGTNWVHFARHRKTEERKLSNSTTHHPLVTVAGRCTDNFTRDVDGFGPCNGLGTPQPRRCVDWRGTRDPSV